MKTIVFIPPNGIIKKQDFLFSRLSQYFKHTLKYNIILICIDDKYIDTKNFNRIITVKDTNEILNSLSKIKYNNIISRGWIHSYNFSAELSRKFDNVTVIIKDWNLSNKKEFKFLFGHDTDFDAIKCIFKNATHVLSHYSNKQAKIWAKQYKTEKNKFTFFPEYCNESNFQKKSFNFNPKNKINLVLGGTIAPSSYPEEFFVTKGILRQAKRLSKYKICTNLVLPPNSYDDLFLKKYLYQDLLYENQFNPNFNIYKGEVLESNVLDKFDFAFFMLEYTTKNEYLNKYSVPSKFAFYLEAGIPMIVNKKMKTLSKLVQKNNLGIVYDNSDLNDLDKILRISKKEYKAMLKSIIKFRDTFLFDFKGIL